jgi:hypothetical protein
MGKSWPSKSSRETPEIKRKTIYKNSCLVFVLGGTFGLFFHGEDINMVKGHNIVL